MSALRTLLGMLAGILSGGQPEGSAGKSAGARGHSTTRKPVETPLASESQPEPQARVPRSSRGREPAQLGNIESGIRSTVEAWRGVPYEMGGTDRSGIDCSAFVRGMYADLFDCDLPRTSRDQATLGRKVDRNDLHAGDLVFFKISDRTRHVGAYLGNGEFGHASTSKGPVVSRLGSSYWDERYWTARRVL